MITMHKKKHITILLFVLPALIPILLFWIYPILKTLFISFTTWDYMTSDFQFTGLSNYKKLFVGNDFVQALLHTITFTVGSVIPTVLGGLCFALLLHNRCKGYHLYRALLFSPWITPTVAISLVFTWIYEPQSGIANQVLHLLGFSGLPWIHSSSTAMLSVIFLTCWKGIGYAMIFYLLALNKVPKELYEAAKVDGAGKGHLFFHITLPLISPTTFFLFITNVIQALQAYDQIQVLTQGGPSGSTRTLLYLYYQLGFEQYETGSAAAVAIMILLITLFISALQYLISKKFVHYEL